jgi:tetratricopeptide (TPR) repeat protein
MVYARMRNYPAAEADLSKAIGLSEKQTLGFITAENYAARGDVNVLQNKRDLAISDYKKALEYDVTNKRAKAGLQKLGLQP